MPTIVFNTSIGGSQLLNLENKFPSIRFVSDPVNMEVACRECDLAVCHGSHGTLAALLLAGKPAVAIPLHLEQVLLCQRLVALGAGLVVRPKEPQNIESCVRELVGNPTYRTAASRFAQLCKPSPNEKSERMISNWVEI